MNIGAIVARRVSIGIGLTLGVLAGVAVVVMTPMLAIGDSLESSGLKYRLDHVGDLQTAISNLLDDGGEVIASVSTPSPSGDSLVLTINSEDLNAASVQELISEFPDTLSVVTIDGHIVDF